MTSQFADVGTLVDRPRGGTIVVAEPETHSGDGRPPPDVRRDRPRPLASAAEAQGQVMGNRDPHATVGADGKPREMLMIDRRTMTMWLTTHAVTSQFAGASSLVDRPGNAS